MKLLNGQTVTLQGPDSAGKLQDAGVVADQSGPVALAGIMGGNHCAVTDDTKIFMLKRLIGILQRFRVVHVALISVLMLRIALSVVLIHKILLIAWSI